MSNRRFKKDTRVPEKSVFIFLVLSYFCTLFSKKKTGFLLPDHLF